MYFKRGPNKVQNPDNLSDMYDKYVEEMDKVGEYCTDNIVFVRVISKFYKEAVKQILLGKTLQFPFGEGRILIEKKKPNKYKGNRYVDWEKTMQLGKRVYHLNEHSGGYNYFIRWRSSKKVTNQKLYKFIPVRDFKRALAKLIKDKKMDYFEVN